jgi:hypothetical protein
MWRAIAGKYNAFAWTLPAMVVESVGADGWTMGLLPDRLAGRPLPGRRTGAAGNRSVVEAGLLPGSPGVNPAGWIRPGHAVNGSGAAVGVAAPVCVTLAASPPLRPTPDVLLRPRWTRHFRQAWRRAASQPWP